MKSTSPLRGSVGFDALEYCADDAFQPARYVFRERPGGGWQVERNGRDHLLLGAGYRLLRTRACGVCSTDLDRRFLPFPLPQITGHEAVVEDEAGRRFVVEINASHRALNEAPCAFCAAGLDAHCPSRLVLGIHDLPGGFGPWLLAPGHALIPVPDTVPDATAALVEPFAAALRAVTVVDPKPGATIAVLGPRRLGMLVVAALAAYRRATGRHFEIIALARRPELATLAVELGADRGVQPPPDPRSAQPMADVVIDTTGSPEGLALACVLATHEVHLKSTHGQPALGCEHLTEAVVDEIAFGAVPAGDDGTWPVALDATQRLCDPELLRVGWLCDDAPPPALADGAIEILQAASAARLLERLEEDHASASAERSERSTLPRVDVLVVDHASRIDDALRPDAEREVSPLRPRGLLLIRAGSDEGPAIGHVLMSGLRISTSRCGDFRQAMALIEADDQLRSIGDVLVTHRFDAACLGGAFDAARSPDAIKVLIEHAVQENLHRS